MAILHPALSFAHALPYGAILHEGGVQFVVYSRSATSMKLLLYDKVTDRDPKDVILFDDELGRWGHVWSLFVPGLGPGQLYHLQADGPFNPHEGHRFNGSARLIDPWTQALAGEFLPADDGILRPPKCVVVDDHFDWQGDRHLRRPLSESIIYEMHVRGFTRHRSSRVEHPGTYLGVIEKIPYLQSLGVTAVELMPVHEFPTNHHNGRRQERGNYWGYDPLAFFAPHRGYAADHTPGAQVVEFKQMVRALHQAGIEVILDVVFNHTCEGNELGPTLSFKGLENKVYYMLTDDFQGYRNYSGCGNTVNGNHPIVRELIFHCLRHWVQNYHVDGFRFDLASILSRGRRGEMLPNPPIIEHIAEDAVLADTKIIAEAWDAAGAYQVGSFPGGRWAEWNGRYRDDMRRFWRGDPGLTGGVATRITGSSDLYQASGRRPYHSINFIISHDGFTLNDLVSYNHKHNAENGEHNRDGDNNNYSFNFGVEGPTHNRLVEVTRQRQLKNMLSTMLLSLGVPMILMGDECRRTQRGNNNAYCQDNDIAWFNWDLVKKHSALLRFVRGLIAFRRHQPTVRRTTFLNGRPQDNGYLADVAWFNADGHPTNWDYFERCIVCLRGGHVPGAPDESGSNLAILMNAGFEPRRFTLPEFVRHRPWSLFIDTAATAPRDIYPQYDGPLLPADGQIVLASRSLVCLLNDPHPKTSPAS